MYLPLFAITTGIHAGTGDDVFWTADVVAGLIVVLQAIFVIGLRILGQKMSDPYGYDLEDLSVLYFCDFTWRNSQKILEAWKPPACSQQVEDTLIANRTDKEFQRNGSTFLDARETEENDTDLDQEGLPKEQLQAGVSYEG